MELTFVLTRWEPECFYLSTQATLIWTFAGRLIREPIGRHGVFNLSNSRPLHAGRVKLSWRLAQCGRCGEALPTRKKTPLQRIPNICPPLGAWDSRILSISRYIYQCTNLFKYLQAGQRSPRIYNFFTRMSITCRVHGGSFPAKSLDEEREMDGAICCNPGSRHASEAGPGLLHDDPRGTPISFRGRCGHKL